MELGSNLSRAKRKRGVGRVKAEYPTNLQLYKVPPVETISLQEFEELAEQRHKRKNLTTSRLFPIFNLPFLVLMTWVSCI